MRVNARVVLLVCVLPLCGCSLIFVERPPAKHVESAHLTCTTGQALPILDTVFAGLEVARTVYAATADQSVYDKFPISRGADIALGVGFAALFAASAGYGYVHTSMCVQLHGSESPEETPQPPLGTATLAQTRRLAPQRPRGPACTYDAQCEPTHVCEGGECIAYRPSVTPP